MTDDQPEANRGSLISVVIGMSLVPIGLSLLFVAVVGIESRFSLDTAIGLLAAAASAVALFGGLRTFVRNGFIGPALYLTVVSIGVFYVTYAGTPVYSTPVRTLGLLLGTPIVFVSIPLFGASVARFWASGDR